MKLRVCVFDVSIVPAAINAVINVKTIIAVSGGSKTCLDMSAFFIFLSVFRIRMMPIGMARKIDFIVMLPARPMSIPMANRVDVFLLPELVFKDSASVKAPMSIGIAIVSVLKLVAWNIVSFKERYSKTLNAATVFGNRYRLDLYIQNNVMT